MPTRPIVQRLIALLLFPILLGGLLVACGGDDGGGAATGDETDTTDDGTDEGDATDDVSGGGGGSGGDFCSQMESADDVFEGLDEQDAFGDSTALGELFGQMSTMLRGIDAPSAIADDWRTMVDALDTMAEAFEGIDFNDPEAMEGMAEEMAAIQEQFADFEEVGDRITTYVREECGIDLDD